MIDAPTEEQIKDALSSWSDGELDAHIKARHEPQRNDEKTVGQYAALAYTTPRNASNMLAMASINGTLVDGCKVTRRKFGREFLYRFVKA